MGERPEPPRNRFEAHPRLTLTAVALALLLALDLLLARLLPAAAEPDDGESRYRVSSPSHHHDLAPRVRIDDARWGRLVYPVRTNSLGMKDAAVREVPLAPAGRRIVLLGDSFTEGIGLPFEATFAGMLAARLAARNVEVLNAAVASYSPVTHLAKVRHLVEDVGLRFDELIVFLDVGDAQDELFYRLDAEGRVVEEPDSRELASWLRSRARARDETRGETARGLRDFLRSLAPASLLARGASRLAEAALAPDAAEADRLEWQRALRNRRTLWPGDEALRRQYADRGNARARTHMDRLLDLVRAHGIGLRVAVYPRRVQIHHGDLDSLQVSLWRDWAADRGVPFLDFFPCFIGREPWREVVERDFIPGDSHWNERGHRRIFEGLMRHLEDGSPPCPAGATG